MSLFLRCHGFKLSSSLPALPTRPNTLFDIVTQYIDLVPVDLFHIWANASTTTLQPSPELQAINEAILHNPKLKDSNAGKHWLNLWHFSGITYFYDASISPLLTQVKNPSSPNGITQEHVTRAAIDQINAVLQRGDESLREQESILGYLEQPRHDDSEAWTKWEQLEKPLLKRFIDEIDEIRTAEWQRDPNRTPAVLPDTYPMKLWLLSYPERREPQVTNEEELTRFVDELAAEVEKLGRSGRPYDKAFEKLTRVADFHGHQHCFMACQLGALDRFSDPPELADFLRVQLADHLLRKGNKDTPTSHKKASEKMLATWTVSEHEEIRMRAIKMAKYFEGKNWLANL